MAIDLNNWVPKYVKQVLDYSSGQSIKATRWNELWNLSIEQGDYNSETLDLLIDLVHTKSDDEEIKEILATKADQAWVVAQLALKTDVSVFDAFRNQQNSTNQTVQTALNNRYTKAETDERLNLKFDKTDAQPLLKEVTFDSQTGVFTITRQNGTTFQINTLLEKVPVQFLLEDNKLILIAEDGTRQEADLSAFIDVYTFQDSATVQFVQIMSTNHTVTASVKDKSIGFEQLKDDVYQSISDDRVAAEAAAESALASKTAAENAAAQATAKASEASQSAATALESKNTAVASAESASVSEQSAERDALMAQSYAVGGTGIRPGEDTDNAKYYAQQAGEIAGGDFATKIELQQHEQYAEETYAKKDEVPQGVIKADGTTVTNAMIPFAQGAKNASGALGEAQFRNVYFGDTELVEGESELPEGTLYITPDVDGSGNGSGSSLPPGGAVGQVLTKTEDGSAWVDVPQELPVGGTTGQILIKKSENNYDVEWIDAVKVTEVGFADSCDNPNLSKSNFPYLKIVDDYITRIRYFVIKLPTTIGKATDPGAVKPKLAMFNTTAQLSVTFTFNNMPENPFGNSKSIFQSMSKYSTDAETNEVSFYQNEFQVYNSTKKIKLTYMSCFTESTTIVGLASIVGVPIVLALPPEPQS